jgi:LemA protein
MGYALAVLVLLLLGAAAYAAAVYNKLVSYRVEAENSWSQIDVQLKRRHDLIPNLVETVKGVMKFEQETLVKIVEARSRAVGARVSRDRMDAEGEISGCLGRLMVVWEDYPDLKANRNAMKLQEELTTTENRIAYSRGHYNDIVANLNTLVRQFPAVIVASVAGFRPKEYFRMADAERAAPRVSP